MNTTPNTPKDGENIALLGIAANISLATVKFLGGVFGNSYALIADAIESARSAPPCRRAHLPASGCVVFCHLRP